MSAWLVTHKHYAWLVVAHEGLSAKALVAQGLHVPMAELSCRLATDEDWEAERVDHKRQQEQWKYRARDRDGESEPVRSGPRSRRS